ncbi:MAG: DEAD/DEAH box helicase family protein [Candidatus Absconditabacterales bacterium]
MNSNYVLVTRHSSLVTNLIINFKMFDIQSSYQPSGDQPKAISQIKKLFESGKHKATLLGATGTGKTFTMANMIQHIQKPTLIISHNKTLAAQLATEFKHFFPNNAVHYFVSYFDYYQPESYLPAQGLYIDKEATINKEIEMYRLATMASLLSREDVIVVASVSSLYGLGQKRFFEENCLKFEIGKEYDFNLLKRQLLKMQYKPIMSKIEHGMFEFKGDIIDIFSSTEKFVYRLHFNEEILELIELKDSTSFEFRGKKDQVILWPATQFLQDVSDLENILKTMDKEKEDRVKEFEKQGMLVEAERIKKRVEYDIRMIRETGFVNGIENYSVYFDNRSPGEPPNTIFDYFPDDFLLIIDESHMTLPQLRAMPEGDKSRKNNLIKYGFRLPSASDHRPLNFQELEYILGWNKNDSKELDTTFLKKRMKHNSHSIFLSATPSEYELQLSDKIVQQIIRPTGLLDPITSVYPKSGDYQILIDSIEKLIKEKPHLKEFLNGYEIKDGIEEVFGD